VELGPRYDGACEVPLSACVERILDVFLDTWKPGEKRLKEYAILERDNWTCQAPGCTCRRNLHVHHIIFRSREGSTDEPWNLITLCAAHHLQGVHLGLVTLSGRAPDGLTWGLAAPVRHLRWERLEIQARSVRT